MAILPQSEPVPFGPDDAGVLRVGGTRVTLDTVVAAFNGGATPEQIAQDFPSLALADVYAVIGFYLRHRADVGEYLQQQGRDAQGVRRQMESAFDPQGVRQRLMARQAKGKS